MRQLSAIAALASTATLFGSFAAVGQSMPSSSRGHDSPATAPSSAPATPPRQSLPRGRLEAGYLARGLPDSLVLSPPPPAPGSAAEARDAEAAKAAVALRGTPRWRLAVQDADLFTAGAPAAFSCTLEVAIGPETTPRLDRLLKKSLADLSDSTSAIKERYARARPFMVNGEANCTPEAERSLRGNGSYPSGHSAIGFGWGLILAELMPERAARIVARGRAFGDSRRICNVHWLSDTEEARIAAAATVARLHAEPAFRADMAAAREELRKARKKPERCADEAAALGT